MRRVSAGLVVLCMALTLGIAGAGLAYALGTSQSGVVRHINAKIHGTWGIYANGSAVYVFAMSADGLPSGARVSIVCALHCDAHEVLRASPTGKVVSSRFKNLKLSRGAVINFEATRVGFDGFSAKLLIVANPHTKTVYRETVRCLPSPQTASESSCTAATAVSTHVETLPATTAAGSSSTVTSSTSTTSENSGAGPATSSTTSTQPSTTTTTTTTTSTTTTTTASTSTGTTTTNAGPDDLNGDGVVNCDDLTVLKNNYGQHTSVGDLNGDGVVNVLDLSIFLSNYQGPACS